MLRLRTDGAALNPNQVGCQEMSCIQRSSASDCCWPAHANASGAALRLTLASTAEELTLATHHQPLSPAELTHVANADGISTDFATRSDPAVRFMLCRGAAAAEAAPPDDLVRMNGSKSKQNSTRPRSSCFLTKQSTCLVAFQNRNF